MYPLKNQKASSNSAPPAWRKKAAIRRQSSLDPLTDRRFISLNETVIVKTFVLETLPTWAFWVLRDLKTKKCGTFIFFQVRHKVWQIRYILAGEG